MAPVKVKLEDDVIPTVDTKLSLSGVVSVPPLGTVLPLNRSSIGY